MTHELILLSPYRYPAGHAMTLADEDMACWLNAVTALWHPALLWQAQGPPRCDSPYDHEQPKPGCIYALPDSPPACLPEDWEERVRSAGAAMFRATADRTATLANLRATLEAEGAPAVGWVGGFSVAEDKVSPFFGLGLGHLLQAALAEAMEHENLLDPIAFWDDVRFAIALLAGFAFSPIDTNIQASVPASAGMPEEDVGYYEGPPPENEPAAESIDGPAAAPLPRDWHEPLVSAAKRLQSAREVLYPVTIHLLDLCLVDDNALERPWPAGMDLGMPLNVLSSTATLEKLAAEQPAKFETLCQAVADGRTEVVGGSYLERADPLLPIDSQLWNLRYGLDRAKELLGSEVRVYARKRFGFHPHMPLFLSSNGVTRALLLTFDDSSGLPHYTGTVVSWPSPDGKQIEAFARAPKPADSPETFFNLGHTWFKTTREDQAATLVLLHGHKPTQPWYRDLMELAKLAPVFGTWTTFSRYLAEVMPNEYPPVLTADDFHSDLLNERIEVHQSDPVSSFARHLRTRRRLDACFTYAALHRSLAGVRDTLQVEDALRQLENDIERQAHIGTPPPALPELESQVTTALAARLQARAAADQPGYMILNPCGFARRVALELEGASRPLPVEGAVKACQLDGSSMRLVAEVPALGFLWLPREGPAGARPMQARLRLGDPTSMSIRNEFMEAEVDAATGALRALRDTRTHINRLGQQLVFNPERSRMIAREVKVTSTGPALGEIVAEGTIVGEHNQLLANFRQRLRLWLGRPLLEMRIEIEPQQPPAGYPWHAYYGARFAWRDEREVMVRGVSGTSYITQHPRPQTPDYIEIRQPPRSNTVLFPGGLPFHQRQGGRMLDVIMVTEGERTATFELGLALDREVPMQTALGYASPLAVVPTTKGPPHIGASGWLFHIDASNLLLTRLVPGVLDPGPGEPLPGPRDAVVARFLECAGYSGLAEFRCVRDPQRALVLNNAGQYMLQANVSGDVVHLEVTPNDLVQVQVEFT
jgi:hypothetical protein